MIALLHIVPMLTCLGIGIFLALELASNRDHNAALDNMVGGGLVTWCFASAAISLFGALSYILQATEGWR
jgi:cytochrome c oxidase assembly factor CtaG